MYLDEIFAGFQFVTAAEYEDVEDERRLLQQGDSSSVDLQSIIRSEVRRGDPDTSAPMSKLGFTVSLVDYDVDRLSLKYSFDNPLSVSIGEQPDKLMIEFVEPQLFTSKETGKTMPVDSNINMSIPK